ncbi:hypothetical protein [Thalassotalea sp. PP2-459]|uniref:hypothetical protein n=1 Tax=Thalassotalea sp. PP2-459 TaxID=1742724 RepID=UPI00094483B3|nr:hypothetical protein [Thalassotalea sp. PP2-459]OKY25848.1 hypothetical protein BI291_14680 [Thalassotalea sp. PP2-459]
MRKIFEFNVKGHKVKVINHWFGGMKLYVDGNIKDTDSSLFAFGKTALLSTGLDDHGVLEILPISRMLSVEIDAVLNNNKKLQHVYSSHRRLSLQQQRLAK